MQIVNESGTLKICGELRIAEADQLRDALFAYLTQTQTLQIDLSAVESCDTAALQLFLSLRLSAEKSGKSLQLVTTSSRFKEDVMALGVTVSALAYAAEGSNA